MPKAIRLHFRTVDSLHRKGDHFESGTPFRIGQTPECELTLAAHPDLADSCYAVVIPDGDRWYLLRQEQDADIWVNGLPFGMAATLGEGDRIAFDHTELRVSFVAESVSSGPAYLTRRRSSPVLWGGVILLFLLVGGILGFLYEQGRTVPHLFADEMDSIYAVRADSLIVERDGVRVDAFALDPPRVGTGFATEDGCFVTARHCLEFWLCDETLLRRDTSEIASEAVRWAIRAELDTTLHLRSVVSVIDRDGQ